MTKERRHILTPTKVRGIPDLLVEILSPSNPGHDLKTKRQAYEKHGVPEYWIFDPDEHQVLQLTLDSGRYQEQRRRDAIAMPPHVEVDLTKVW